MSPQKINLTVEYRSKPAYKWVLVEPLGKMAGGLNSGINLVRTTTPNAQASKLLFIEKRFRPTDFKHKVPYREIQMLHQLGDHPNITTMIDHFIDEKTLTGSVYLELCDMGNMAEVVAAVANGNFVNEHKVWNWFIQVTEALVYCHWGSRPEMTADELLQSGWSKVYHRDIKPANILLTREENQIVAKLADFGCAKSEDFLAHQEPKDAIRASVLTPGFDAPEYPYFSGASDVWQLGLSILCLCTGNLIPRSNHNKNGKSWDKERPAGPKYSTELSWSLRFCLAGDTKKRPNVKQILRYLNKQYDVVMNRLPANVVPLEIWDHRGGQVLNVPQPGPPEAYGQPMPPPRFIYPAHQPGRNQHPVRPGLPGHMLSDPGIDHMGQLRQMGNPFGQQIPYGPFLMGMRGLHPSMFEEEHDGPRIPPGYDPHMFGGFNLMFNPHCRGFR